MRATDATELVVDGRPIRVRISGPEDGSPVLLLHGIARSLEDWSASHDLLARRHRVVSADLPGFGFTGRSAKRPGLASFARSMAGVLDAAGIDRPAHVMGNSLGGGIAMTLAVDHPGAVASLVLVDSVGFGREVRISPLPMLYATLSAAPVIGSRFVPLAREAAVQINRDQFHDPSLATPALIKHYARVGRQPDFRGTFLGTAATLGIPMIGTYPGWRRELLARVRAAALPTLVVWGASDKVLPAAHLEGARRALPQARFHLFDETGHMPQIERSAEFCALAGEFIDGVDAEQSAAGSAG